MIFHFPPFQLLLDFNFIINFYNIVSLEISSLSMARHDAYHTVCSFCDNFVVTKSYSYSK